MEISALHDRKIGFGPVEKVVGTTLFKSFKRVIM